LGHFENTVTYLQDLSQDYIKLECIISWKFLFPSLVHCWICTGDGVLFDSKKTHTVSRSTSRSASVVCRYIFRAR